VVIWQLFLFNKKCIFWCVNYIDFRMHGAKKKNKTNVFMGSLLFLSSISLSICPSVSVSKQLSALYDAFVFAGRAEISQPVSATHTPACGLPSFSQVIFQHSWYLLVSQIFRCCKITIIFSWLFLLCQCFPSLTTWITCAGYLCLFLFCMTELPFKLMVPCIIIQY